MKAEDNNPHKSKDKNDKEDKEIKEDELHEASRGAGGEAPSEGGEGKETKRENLVMDALERVRRTLPVATHFDLLK